MDEGDSINDYPGFKVEPMNITAALNGIVAWLKGSEGY
jgi:energy-converting hydrogenase Eha subunit F